MPSSDEHAPLLCLQRQNGLVAQYGPHCETSPAQLDWMVSAYRPSFRLGSFTTRGTYTQGPPPQRLCMFVTDAENFSKVAR